MLDRSINITCSGDDDSFEFVGSIDPGMPYQFDTLMVLQDKTTGHLYYAQDSGCSCPQPFARFTTLSSLTRIFKTKLREFEEVVLGYRGVRVEDRMELIQDVRAKLGKGRKRVNT
jgi:hypothetical protein